MPAFARSWLSRLLYGAKPDFRNVVTPEPSLVLWIENTPGGRPPAAPTGRTWLMIADESGQTAGGSRFYSGRYGARKTAVTFAQWPRSSRKLILRWFEVGEFEAAKFLGEWVVSNPAYQTPNRWPDTPLPHTLTNGPLRCTLERVLGGLGSEPRRTVDADGSHLHFEPARSGEVPAVVLVPRFTADAPAEHWVIGSAVLRDVGGNQVHREPLWLRVAEGCCYFTPALWPADSWELRLSAKRQVPLQLPVAETFAPEEVLVFREVELPGPGDNALNLSEERHGARLQLTQFTMRPPKDLNEPWDPAEASELRATLWRSTNESVHVDLAGVLDEHGQAHYPQASGFSASEGQEELGLNYHFPTLPMDARRLTITFVVQRGREFRFYVKPERARSGVSLP